MNRGKQEKYKKQKAKGFQDIHEFSTVDPESRCARTDMQLCALDVYDLNSTESADSKPIGTYFFLSGRVYECAFF